MSVKICRKDRWALKCRHSCCKFLSEWRLCCTFALKPRAAFSTSFCPQLQEIYWEHSGLRSSFLSKSWQPWNVKRHLSKKEVWWAFLSEQQPVIYDDVSHFHNSFSTIMAPLPAPQTQTTACSCFVLRHLLWQVLTGSLCLSKAGPGWGCISLFLSSGSRRAGLCAQNETECFTFCWIYLETWKKKELV